MVYKPFVFRILSNFYQNTYKYPCINNKMLKHYDETFKFLIEKDFLPDLVLVSNFKSVELSEEEKMILDILKGKYMKGCPSEFYSRASKHLQREYGFFHKVISEWLY